MSTIKPRILPHLPLYHPVKAQGSSQPRPAGGKRQQIGVLNLGFCSTFPTFASGLQQEIGHGLSVEELCLRANCRPKPFCRSIGHKVGPPCISEDSRLIPQIAPFGSRFARIEIPTSTRSPLDFRRRFGRTPFPQVSNQSSVNVFWRSLNLDVDQHKGESSCRGAFCRGACREETLNVLYPGVNQVEVFPWSPERTISLLIRSSK